MSCTSQNFRLFHVSNLSVRNFRIFLLMYPGSMNHDISSPALPAITAGLVWWEGFANANREESAMELRGRVDIEMAQARL